MTRKTVLITLLAVAALVLGALWRSHLQAAEPKAPASPAVARLLGQTLQDAAGQPQALAQWRGKVTVVNFWATWCPPCVQEMPELVALQGEVAPRDIHIIGIGIDSPSNIAEFSGKYHISYPVYVGGMGGTGLLQDLGNKAGSLPYTVLIGADGAIKKTYLGRLDFARLRTDLAAL